MMNMFSSGLRLFNSENSENSIARKQDITNLAVVRKPFADKTINCHSPNLGAVKKPLSDDLDVCETLSQYSDDDLNNEDLYTYHEVNDAYEDIIPLSNRLENVHVEHVFAKFLADDDSSLIKKPRSRRPKPDGYVMTEAEEDLMRNTFSNWNEMSPILHERARREEKKQRERKKKKKRDRLEDFVPDPDTILLDPN